MSKHFSTIAILGRPRSNLAIQTHQEIYDWLIEREYKVLVDDRLRDRMENVDPAPLPTLCA